jgi:hypothetical protein
VGRFSSLQRNEEYTQDLQIALTVTARLAGSSNQLIVLQQKDNQEDIDQSAQRVQNIFKQQEKGEMFDQYLRMKCMISSSTTNIREYPFSELRLK